jgi:hypothetical protein
MARNHATNDYGVASPRARRVHRAAMAANHALHWISSIVVLGISAYFIHEFANSVHLVYWVTIVSIPTYIGGPVASTNDSAGSR